MKTPAMTQGAAATTTTALGNAVSPTGAVRTRTRRATCTLIQSFPLVSSSSSGHNNVCPLNTLSVKNKTLFSWSIVSADGGVVLPSVACVFKWLCRPVLVALSIADYSITQDYDTMHIIVF